MTPDQHSSSCCPLAPHGLVSSSPICSGEATWKALSSGNLPLPWTFGAFLGVTRLPCPMPSLFFRDPEHQSFQEAASSTRTQSETLTWLPQAILLPLGRDGGARCQPWLSFLRVTPVYSMGSSPDPSKGFLSDQAQNTVHPALHLDGQSARPT